MENLAKDYCKECGSSICHNEECLSLMDKIKRFAELLEKQQIERLKKDNLDCQANIDNARVHIKEGKKYTKVNVGSSGKYMIDSEGNIFGIKGYGVINKSHYFGTLDTINEYYWGNYKAYKLINT